MDSHAPAPPHGHRPPVALRRTGGRVGWWFVLVPGAVVALYALSYLVLRERVFPPQLAASFHARPWGIYLHAAFGALAMALGPWQFRSDLRARRRRLHRVMGRTYVAACLVSGSAGLAMAVTAFGGLVTRIGFGLLAVVLLTCTVRAFVSIKRGDLAAHRRWMLRSYAMIFGAVTLRVELPLLIRALGGFTDAYRVVSWLAWVPNLGWAEVYLRRTTLARNAVDDLRPPVAL